MKLTNHVILIIILGISAVLRFYHFTEIPFMHDEFSAVFRTEFSSFSEMIEKGVKPDGHPAGIQVFIYYWIKNFGKAELLIKLPFVLMGILSVWLIYLVGRMWHNDTVAIICASFISALQYTVMYSQIARPYISGFFFSLAMVYFWSRLMLYPSNKFNKNALFYIIASVLCAYNHHFSLLFAAIVGVSGLMFIPRRYLLRYILSGLLIFILYIPHLGIFQAQLHTGGVGGWLAKPEKTFFLEYLYYIFNYSLLSVFTALALFLTGFYYFKKSPFNWRREILFTVWFILPVIIGYWYSVQYNPVLQYSVLLFSFFPLMFILFGNIPKQKSSVNLMLAAVILSVNIFTLISERQHYRIFYASPYENIVSDYVVASQKYSNVVPVIDSHKRITSYYLEKH